MKGPNAGAAQAAHGENGSEREFANICPQDIRLSSRELAWGPLHLERRECEPDAVTLAAGRTEHLIGVSLSAGKVTLEYDGQVQTLELQPGSVSIVPSESTMHWAWSTRMSFAVMALSPAFLLEVARDALGLDAAQVRLRAGVHGADPAVATVASTLSRELIDGRPGSEVYAKSLAHILAVHLLRNYNEVSPPVQAQPIVLPTRPVARAVQHIRTHFADELSLADLAAAAQVSPFHLARLFKQATGRSPHQYLIEVRVNHARALLTAGASRSLADVAEAVGFADQSHLTRHMKRLLGVTPGELRGQANGAAGHAPGRSSNRGAHGVVRSLKEGAKRALSSAPTLRSPATAG